MVMRGVTLLGSTGSIGTNTLAVIARQPRRFKVVALTAHGSVDTLLAQCLRFQPEYAVLATASDAERMRQQISQIIDRAGPGKIPITAKV
ncbi:MAG: hypothetical protein EHM59_16300, partial [Betaproteobacteria bacterium]